MRYEKLAIFDQYVYLALSWKWYWMEQYLLLDATGTRMLLLSIERCYSNDWHWVTMTRSIARPLCDSWVCCCVFCRSYSHSAASPVSLNTAAVQRRTPQNHHRTLNGNTTDLPQNAPLYSIDTTDRGRPSSPRASSSGQRLTRPPQIFEIWFDDGAFFVV